MPVVVSFVVNGPPVGQGSMVLRQGRIAHTSSGRLIAWRHAIGWAAKARMSTQPVTGPVLLRLAFTLPGSYKPAIRPPDLDKLVRAVNDALTGIAFVDDAQVVEMVCSKRYGPTPGVEVSIEEV